MLKKVLVLALVLVFFMSCNNSVDEPTSKFNPPSWIIGEWQDDSGFFGYKFTSNDIIQITSGVELSFNDIADSFGDEISSDTEYTIPTIIEDYYKFVKKSDTIIDLHMSSISGDYTTEMTKQ